MRTFSFLLTTLALVSFLSTTHAQSTKVKKVNKTTPQSNLKAYEPIFKFLVNDNTHDFGVLEEGPTATYEFQFINAGNAPLLITNAQANCGCTSPEFPREPILPGKKGKIKVTYTTEGHPGNFMKSVYLTSNAPTNTHAFNKDYYEIRIKGIVKPKNK